MVTLTPRVLTYVALQAASLPPDDTTIIKANLAIALGLVDNDKRYDDSDLFRVSFSQIAGHALCVLEFTGEIPTDRTIIHNTDGTDTIGQDSNDRYYGDDN